MQKLLHINELTYSAYKDMAGMSWSIFILLLFVYPPGQSFRILTLSVVALVSLLPFIWVIIKKASLRGKLSYALSRRYPVIAMDFLWKYIVFGIGMFLIRAAIDPEILFNPQSELKLVVFIIHAAAAFILLILMKIMSKNEREPLNEAV